MMCGNDFMLGRRQEEIVNVHCGNTLQMGQLVKPKLILGPLHREVNTALFLDQVEVFCKEVHP